MKRPVYFNKFSGFMSYLYVLHDITNSAFFLRSEFVCPCDSYNQHSLPNTATFTGSYSPYSPHQN